MSNKDELNRNIIGTRPSRWGQGGKVSNSGTVTIHLLKTLATHINMLITVATLMRYHSCYSSPRLFFFRYFL